MADVTSSVSFVPVANSELEDVSYTISLDIQTQSWISFHDWIPDFQFSNRNELFTVLDRRLFVHDRGPINNFYGTDYPSIISAILVSPREELERKVPFLLNSISVEGSKPTTSWIFNNNQTSDYTDWIPRLDTLTLVDNYDNNANCYFQNGNWQFNSFRNCRLLDNFVYNHIGLISLNQDAIEGKVVNNRIIGDHLVTQLIFEDSTWYFTGIGYTVSWNL